MKTTSMSVFGCVALLAALNSQAGPKVEEQVAGPASKILGTAISPRGAHLAALIPKGSRYAVWVDGVEGPKIDEYLGTSGTQQSPPGYGNLPFAFSDDGSRWAYFAKMGDEYVVMVDGKEFARGKLTPESHPADLQFSPGGKLLIYSVLLQQGASHNVYVDGKPGPLSVGEGALDIKFSPDGTQYAYLGSEPGKPDAKWTMVSGRQVKRFGEKLQYTGNGHLVAQTFGSGFQGLTLDGKPVMQVANIQGVWVSPFSGGQIAAVAVPKPGAPPVLTLNGKAVPGTEGCQVREVHFSPDGKRFAAYCVTPTMTGHFVVIDGKKGQEYQAVSNFQFTPDSTKAVYNARALAGNFLVVEDEESDGYQNIPIAVIGGGGKRIGYIAWNAAPQVFVGMDNKVTECKNASSLTFSPDGSRYAFQVGRGSPGSLWIDGVEQTGFQLLAHQESSPQAGVRKVLKPGTGYVRVYEDRAEATPIGFSPDGKHYAVVGCPPGTMAGAGFVLDGKLMPTGQYTVNHWLPRFSPDSRHLFCVFQGPDGLRLEVDGQPAVTFAIDLLCTVPGNWDMGSDGVMTFVAVADGNLKRFRVSASPDTNLETLLASATK